MSNGTKTIPPPRALMRAAGLACVLLGSQQKAHAEARPKVPYWHVWTDLDGQSHQTLCELQDFDLQSINPPASPQWLDRMKTGDAAVVFTVLRAGWTWTKVVPRPAA